MEVIYPISPIYVVQGFGENPANYSRFGLAGHNGWDFRTKYPDTPEGFREIWASWDSRFYKKADEGSDGYGKYFEVFVYLYSVWKVTYAHCKSIESFDRKQEEEKMAISDNTGNSTASHLHLTVKRVSVYNGRVEVLDYGNGFKGAVNPEAFFNELRQWKKEHPTMPEITDQTKIYIGKDPEDNLWSGDGYMEIQAIRGTLNDQFRAIKNLKEQLAHPPEPLETTPPIPPETETPPQNAPSEAVASENPIFHLISQFIRWIKSFFEN